MGGGAWAQAAGRHMSVKPEEKVVFGIAPATDGSAPLVLLGVSAAAWEYMRDGKTHTFDLTSLGLPLKLVMFGGTTRGAVTQEIEKINEARGLASLHLPGTDFSIKAAGPK